MSLLLGVNIDHIATLRQARYAKDASNPNAEPSPLIAGLDALAGGADSLTIHVRGDRRHMQDADAFLIRKNIALPLNLEMGVTDEMYELATLLQPEFVCLVPETREEVTTEGGLDVAGAVNKVKSMTQALQNQGACVSLFIDPDEHQVLAAVETGSKMIELHTGCFANAQGNQVAVELERLTRAAKLAHAHSIQVNAGHGINYQNIKLLLNVPHLAELNIGHSIIARSTRVGLETAVREMKQLMKGYPAA